MEQLIAPVWRLLSSQLGLEEMSLLVLAAVALYGWHQFQRARHLAEANEHERRRTQQAVEELDRLKRDASDAPATGDRRRAPADGRRCTSRVLVVEDNEVMQSVIPAMLARCLTSVEVRIQETAKDAVEEMQRFKPELLVLDLRLENESGVHLLDYLRAANARLPVLVYSGYDEEIERLRIIYGTHGMENVTILQKGSDLDVFMQIVPTLFRRRTSDRMPAAPGEVPRRERRAAGERRVSREPMPTASGPAMTDRRRAPPVAVPAQGR